MEKKIKYELVNGLHMGIESIDELLCKVENEQLKSSMMKLKQEYTQLYKKLIHHYPDAKDEIKTNIMADAMLKMKAMMSDDQKITKMLIEGCNQGVMTSAQLYNLNYIIEPNLKSCLDDFNDISSRYVEELKIYL